MDTPKKIKGCLVRKKVNGKPSGQYYTQFRSKYLPYEKLVQPTRTQDWNEANAILAQRAEELSKGIDLKAKAKRESVSLDEVMRSYLDTVRTRGRKDISRITSRGQRLVAHYVFRGLLARDVTYEHGERYRNIRRRNLSPSRTPIKDSTIDRELEILVSALNHAKDKNQISRTPKIQMAHPKNKRQGWLSISQFDKVFPHLCDSMKLFFTIDYMSGCRVGELLQARINDLNLEDEDGYLQLREYTTKTDKPRIIPFWGEMRSWVLWQKSVHDAECPDSPFLFFWHKVDKNRGSNIRPGKRMVADTLLSHWREALKAAHRLDPSIPTHLIVHDLRRSACSNMLQIYKFSIPTTMEISGHICIETLLGYNIPCLANLKSAAKEATKVLRELRGRSEDRKFNEIVAGLTADEEKALLDYLARLRRPRRRNATVKSPASITHASFPEIESR